MNFKIQGNTALSALLVTTLLATGGGLVYARVGGENDAVADLAKAKISLVQAAGAAEAHAGGRAVKAELEGERAALIYQVEVVTADNKVFDVEVDAANGKVLASKADAVDGGKEDKDD